MKKIGRETHHKIIFKSSVQMDEIQDRSVSLVVTSPPYPMIKMWDKMFSSVGCNDYKEMHGYLSKVWEECYRVLIDGGILCINIGDATRKLNGVFRLFANHSKVIEHCEEVGFTTLPYILWKKPSCKPNAFLGSGFLPPNAYVTLDCEYVLIFRKGSLRKFEPKDDLRYKSLYSKSERDIWFSQIWDIKGARQTNKKVDRRLAVYPDEIAMRLVSMFSIYGDVVLDPFLGTGTTTKLAMMLGRNSVGYEVDDDLIDVIREKLLCECNGCKVEFIGDGVTNG